MLLTILGEYVLPRSGAVWQETLVRALGALDYSSQAARQALTRSVSDGWLETERLGRRSRMRLTDGTEHLLRSGAERIYSFGRSWDWDGRWLLVVLRVPEERREVRHQLRTQLAWAGLGSLGNGVWVTPHVDREHELDAVAQEDGVAQMVSFYARTGELGEPRKVIQAAWDLDEVASQYEAFLEKFRALRPSSPESCFPAQTALVHDWRKFPFLDPDLPRELLPARWPGGRAHGLFHRRHERWQEPAQTFFDELEG
jgi:phenylacetic acid degradation operon negative regulatory protein